MPSQTHFSGARLLATKREMRRELSSKGLYIIPFFMFFRTVGVPFPQPNHLCKYLVDQNRVIYISLEGRTTAAPKDTRKMLKHRLNDYPYVGPLGAIGPILPISVGHLYETTHDGKTECEINGRRTSFTSGSGN